jgi:hypothetical protein
MVYLTPLDKNTIYFTIFLLIVIIVPAVCFYIVLQQYPIYCNTMYKKVLTNVTMDNIHKYDVQCFLYKTFN